MNDINGTTTATAIDESDGFGFDLWSNNEGGYVRDAILGCLFCASLLATCFYLSHQYTVGERTHEQEIEKRRLDEINRKLEEVESKRNEIASVIHGYARTMLSITNDDTDNENDDDNNDDDSRTILHGNNESEDDDDDDEDEMIDIEAAVEPVMRLLELDLEEDNDDDEEEVVAVNTNNTTTNMNNTNLYFHEQEQYNNDNNNEGDNVEKEEVHTPVPIPASLLLKAADNNPCAICLEDFVPSDNIIFCSNHITTSNTSTTTTKGGKHTHTHTGYPHCFHEECSLDYMFSHTEGVQAPCPLCRKPFLCSMDNQQEEEEESKETGARREGDSTSTSTTRGEGGEERPMLPSHPSSISLSDLSEAASAEFER